MFVRSLVVSVCLVAAADSLRGETPLGTGFTFQGQIKEDGVPLDGTIDFQFTLWDSAGSGHPPTGGVQIGGAQVINALPVTAGLFTVTLNGGGEFGHEPFNGNARWLQVQVCRPAGNCRFTPLGPRQSVTAAPYAQTALSVLGGAGTDGHSLDAADGSPIDALYVDNNGRVGIGTTTPTVQLDVVGQLHADYINGGVVRSFNPGDTNAQVELSWGPNNTAQLRAVGGGLGGNNGLNFPNQFGGSLMRILGNGNVGIGEANPAACLHVGGACGASSVIVEDESGDSLMQVQSNGNVGIGTATPTVKLQIEGGTDTAPGGGGFLVMGSTAGTNISIDNNEIMARNNGATANLALNGLGGNVTLIQNGVGNVGVGTSAPAVKLHVDGGTDTSPSSGGYIVTGNTSSTNISIDNNEIMARNNGAVATLFLNNSGGDVVVGGALDINYTIVTSYNCTSPGEGANGNTEVFCPAGLKVLGGGCRGVLQDYFIQDSYPIDGGTGWHCTTENRTSIFSNGCHDNDPPGSGTSAWAICARVK